MAVAWLSMGWGVLSELEVVFGILIVLLAVHGRLERDSLGQHCQDFKDGARQVWDRVWRPNAFQTHKHPESMQWDIALEAIRTKTILSALERLLLFTGFLAVFWLIAFAIVGEAGIQHVKGVIAFLTLLYGVLIVLLKTSMVSLTSNRCNLFAQLVMCCFLARAAMMQNEKTWLLNVGIRVMTQVCVSVAMMNTRESIFWSVVFAIVNTWKQLQLARTSLTLRQLDAGVLEFMYPEAVIAMMSSALCLFLHDVTKQHVHSLLEAGHLKYERAIAERFLAAFCDAQVELSNSLQITGSTDRLAQLMCTQAPSSLQGMEFTSILAEDDKPRFLKFIEAATSVSKSLELKEPGPVSSLQVDMHGSSGLSFQAKIFHIAKPDVAGSAHLLGICEVGARQVPSSPEPEADRKEQSLVSTSAFMWHQHARAMSQKSHSSSSSRSSLKSTKLQHLPGLQALVDVTMSLDIFSERLTIEDMNMHFRMDQKPIKLLDIIPQEQRERVSDWICGSMNNVAAGREPELHFNDLELSDMFEYRLIAKATLQIHTAEGTDDSDSEDSGCMNASIVLSSPRFKRKRYCSRNGLTSGQLATIAESSET